MNDAANMTKTVSDIDGAHIIREDGYGTQDGPGAYSYTRLRFNAVCGDREFNVEVYMLDNRREFRCAWAAKDNARGPARGLCPVRGAVGGAGWKIWRAKFKSEAAALAFAESTKIPQGMRWIAKSSAVAA